MSGEVIIYPRGFSRFRGTTDVITTVFSGGDGAVEMLYDVNLARTVNTEGWDYRSKVISEGARLLGGDFKYFLAYNASMNDRVYGLNFEYLVDTANFIRTGRRKLSNTTWIELLLEKPEPSLGIANQKRYLSVHKEDSLTLGQWLAQPDGFEDFLTTLHILFGTPKVALGIIK